MEGDLQNGQKQLGGVVDTEGQDQDQNNESIIPIPTMGEKSFNFALSASLEEEEGDGSRNDTLTGASFAEDQAQNQKQNQESQPIPATVDINTPSKMVVKKIKSSSTATSTSDPSRPSTKSRKAVEKVRSPSIPTTSSSSSTDPSALMPGGTLRQDRRRKRAVMDAEDYSAIRIRTVHSPVPSDVRGILKERKGDEESSTTTNDHDIDLINSNGTTGGENNETGVGGKGVKRVSDDRLEPRNVKRVKFAEPIIDPKVETPRRRVVQDEEDVQLLSDSDSDLEDAPSNKNHEPQASKPRSLPHSGWLTPSNRKRSLKFLGQKNGGNPYRSGKTGGGGGGGRSVQSPAAAAVPQQALFMPRVPDSPKYPLDDGNAQSRPTATATSTDAATAGASSSLNGGNRINPSRKLIPRKPSATTFISAADAAAMIVAGQEEEEDLNESQDIIPASQPIETSTTTKSTQNKKGASDNNKKFPVDDISPIPEEESQLKTPRRPSTSTSVAQALRLLQNRRADQQARQQSRQIYQQQHQQNSSDLSGNASLANTSDSPPYSLLIFNSPNSQSANGKQHNLQNSVNQPSSPTGNQSTEMQKNQLLAKNSASDENSGQVQTNLHAMFNMVQLWDPALANQFQTEMDKFIQNLKENGQASSSPNPRRPTEEEMTKVVQAYIKGAEGTCASQEGNKFTRGSTAMEKIANCFTATEVCSTLVPDLVMHALHLRENELESARCENKKTKMSKDKVDK